MQNDVPSDDNGVAQQPSEYASATEAFFTRFGEELYKRNLPLLNEVLRQLLTTSVALMGGGVAFLGADLCNPDLRIAALIMFFLAVCAALIGVHPYRNNLALGMPYEIMASVENAVWWKDGFIWACSVFIALGLLAAFAGVIIGKPV
jgi:hypothetical protein